VDAQRSVVESVAAEELAKVAATTSVATPAVASELTPRSAAELVAAVQYIQRSVSVQELAPPAAVWDGRSLAAIKVRRTTPAVAQELDAERSAQELVQDGRLEPAPAEYHAHSKRLHRFEAPMCEQLAC
jgi:hypothetical protein